MGNRRGSYYSALKRITKVANSALSSRKVYNSIAKSAAKAVHANGCRISFLAPQHEYLLTAGAYGLSDIYLKKGPLDARKSLPEILDGETVFVADATKDERVQHHQTAEAQRISSILGVPIIKQDEVVGEMRVYTHDPHQFSESDNSFLRSVVDICAVILERTESKQVLKQEYEKDRKHILLTEAPQLPTASLRPASFAHPSESEFAKLLDFYRIEWLYEPRAFPLCWKEGAIAEMFTPDFYLPELDLYVELTTLKQSLITEKNRKVRQLKQLYPDVNIKLLAKDDFVKLLVKYGYGPLGEVKIGQVNKVLFSRSQIQRRVKILAKQISRDYAGQQIVMVGVLRGVICFMADIIQQISLPVTVDFMAISNYGGDGQVVKITKDLDSSITNKHVLMVEDIVDTGMTLNYLLTHLRAHNPLSLNICTLLDKRARRLVDIPLKYVGFEIPDRFVVGYGLDYKEEYRNLPFIGLLNPEVSQVHGDLNSMK